MNNIVKLTLLLILLALFSSCVLKTAPKDDVAFSIVKGIHPFEGCYQNQGEGGNGGPSRHLSAIIWPDSKLTHTEIKLIRVVAVNDKTLKVTAETNETVIKESLFVDGKDFQINSGQIKVKGEPLVSFAYPAGNVFIGVGYASQVIGVDAHGDGKLQESGTFAGTAFLVIPLAGHVEDSYRFRKSEELCKGHP